MQTNYSNFEQGEIIVADILFSVQVGVKRRPVLVLSNSEFNKHSEDIIVLKITSAAKKTEFDVALRQADLEGGELQTESFIMADFPATIDKNMVTQKIGKISKQKLAEVKKKTKELYAL